MKWLIAVLFGMFFSGCAISAVGTKEAVYFSPAGASSVEWVSVFKPYDNLGLTLEFFCPGKATSVMISPVIPLPPIVPVGPFVNKKESSVELVFPEEKYALLQSIHIVLSSGSLLQLHDAINSDRIQKKGAGFLTTVHFKTDCAEFEGGEMQIDGFEYLGKSYPPIKAKLQFKSTFGVDAGYLR